MRTLKEIVEAVKTSCQTNDVKYAIKIKPKCISIQADLPSELEIDEEESKILDANLHNAMELVLSKYFYTEEE